MLVVLFAVSLPAVTPRLYSSDEVQYFSYLRSLYFDRDVSFENEYRYFHERNIAQSPGFHETFLERETAAGRRVNYGTIGSAILWLPFYVVADVWTRTSGAAEANGFTEPYVGAVAYASAFWGFLAILLSIRAARIVLGRASVWTAAAVWLGTPLLFYMYVAPPFAHATSAFAVALFVNVWLHVRQEWSTRGAFALGLCAALMAMVREQDAFLALGPAVDFGLAVVTSKVQTPNSNRQTPNSRLQTSKVELHTPAFRQMLVAAAAGIAGSVVGYLPQLLAYAALNGYPGPAEHVSRKMSWYAPHAPQVLASPHHGFLFWTPLAVLAIAGLVMLLQRQRRLATVLLLMVASQVWVAGSVESWTVAGAFGQRRFVCLTIVLVIGLAALVRSVNRRVAAAGIVLCVWWNVALMAQFATGLMDRQRLEPARNAYHALLTVPRLAPSLAWRYLTDRASFYASTPPRQDP